MNHDSIFGEVIYGYSRSQAIEDGVLVDVSEVAHEVAFRLPVAVTAAVWARCVAWGGEMAGQDEQGRLWDVLWIARLAARSAQDKSEVDYTLRVVQAGQAVEHVELKMAIGPGDDGEPVITIQLADED